jgi:nucleotide-binding universal stress UspA family protein
MKILLAIDGSKFSESALQAVMAQAKPNHTDVRVLHVIEPIPDYADGLSWGYGLQSPNVLQEEREQAQALVEKAARELRDAGFQAETAVEVGDAKAAIRRRCRAMARRFDRARIAWKKRIGALLDGQRIGGRCAPRTLLGADRAEPSAHLNE